MPLPEDRDDRVEIIAQNLRVDGATAEVLVAVASRGLSVRLLKGPTLAAWLYDREDPRPYSDCDLLVAPADITGVAEVLETLGFRPELETDRMPDWWREHAAEWWREADAVLVDLHRTLPGIEADDETAWRVLSAEPDAVDVAGFPAPGLSPPARALHVILHAAQHGTGWARPHEDLRRLLARADEGLMRQSADLAAHLGAIEAFAAALRLLPEGLAAAERLGLDTGDSLAARLRTQGTPRQALGVQQLVQAKGLRARTVFLWRKLFPPVTFMRRWWPPASESRRALVIAYLWHRPLWLLRSLRPAVRAWWRARRDVGR